ncbi:MAG: double-strand break repair helicase AddA [Rhizobiaceae bacterium]|nr:double-strand break repair helicase AddA [Rhizobiaceae bacterium]
MTRFIPEQTIRDQRRASDPAASAWVSANAGSGKTHVLAQRVKRLLLRNIDPSRILCLTYTRAAAANMANRVFKDLAAWALMDDATLDAAIAETGAATGPKVRALARKLFARALETPGGLKIQTIHAFCEAVLHQFPLEANIAGHFELLDGDKETALVAEARRDMIAGVAAGGDPALSEAFADVLDRAGENGLDRLLAEIVRRRDGLRGFIDGIGDSTPRFALLFEAFGFGADETEASICAAAWPIPGFSQAEFREFADTARAVGAANAQKWILPNAEPAFAETDPVRRLTLAVQGFLKDSGEPYGATAFNKALVGRLPDIAERYERAATHLAQAADRLATLRMVLATRSALTVADWLIGRYERLKSARGFLDFNDLVARTAWLLTRDEASAWVHYKLDRGIDHILVDEAQDTSPAQWAVIRSLAEEFFSGAGAAEAEGRSRTVFAVGDEKQSIYSFQGAEPHAFAETRFEFAARIEAGGEAFEHVTLTQSFRSTRDVLEAVDLVFADPAARAGLQRDDIDIVHGGVREGEVGCVEVWSSLGPEVVDEPDDWAEPVDEARAPAVRLATIMAETTRNWVGREIIDEEKGPRPMRPGDILVLVRKRDAFVHALSRALKERHVPVAGADRLLLTDHIAVQDLVAIGRLVQQPQDDLSLAALLRSPIFGWSDEELYAVAYERGRRSLLEALGRAAVHSERAAEALAEIEEWRNAAAFRPAFDFYAGLLAGTNTRTGLRARLIARLGPEAGDVIDEFLSFCAAAEDTGGGELEALLSTLDRAPPEVKREMEHGRDEVRILTVHASKGLEAPVVFLVDPGSAPFHDGHLPTLLPRRFDLDEWHGEGYLWQPGKALANNAVAAVKAGIRAKAEAEYRRLLYVGLTRARDRLVVCGYHGVRGKPQEAWHAMVERAIAASPNAVPLDAPEGCLPAWRFQFSEPKHAAPPVVAATGQVEDAFAPLPDLPHAVEAPPPLRPSAAGLAIDTEAATASARSPVLDGGDDMALAREKGVATHRLLQALPDLPEAERAAAARRYLDRAGRDWPAAELEALLAAVERILAAPNWAPLFGPGSRAEVGVAGRIEVGGREHTVSGKIDRLAVTAGKVTVVDFKTGRPPEGAPPQSHVAQMALYAKLLRKIYEGRQVEAALVYTAGPLMLPLSAATLDAALARLAGS